MLWKPNSARKLQDINEQIAKSTRDRTGAIVSVARRARQKKRRAIRGIALRSPLVILGMAWRRSSAAVLFDVSLAAAQTAHEGKVPPEGGGDPRLVMNDSHCATVLVADNGVGHNVLLCCGAALV
jgi:hypothetical protein